MTCHRNYVETSCVAIGLFNLTIKSVVDTLCVVLRCYPIVG